MISRLTFAANHHLASPQPYQGVSQLAALTQTSCFSRPFTTTRSRQDSFINHYEVLKLPQTCTHAELKKQFYTLSRLTHPDINKSDPNASTRFSQISESYSILADPTRRKRYDRDILRVHQQQEQQSRSTTPNGRAGGGAGSYAGSRPASGLSKRRGVFRGPPPSFYAHGGRDPPPPPNYYNADNTASAGASSSTTNTTNPLNPSQDPSLISTLNTQTHEDTRRQTRREAARAAAQAEMDTESGFWVRFSIVTGLLVAGAVIAGLLMGIGGGAENRRPGMAGNRRKGGLVRSDGSRRDGAGGGNDWTRGGDGGGGAAPWLRRVS